MGIRAQSEKAKQRYAKELERRYRGRTQQLKHGKKAFNAKDYSTAVRCYNSYLTTMAEVHRCEMFSLSPESFDNKRDITELLIISQIYWELAKCYDSSERTIELVHSCLKQFVLFTVDMPFQVLNAEHMRKYIRRRKLRNEDVFEDAYRSIFTQAKSCFIATELFGAHDQVTEKIRALRPFILDFPGGGRAVELYYSKSPWLIAQMKLWPPPVANTARIFLRFFLRLLAMMT